MKRKVLAIPKDEIERHLAINPRQDVKVVAPSILTEELFNILKTKGKDLKPEQYFDSQVWRHSAAEQPNNLCESKEFVDVSLPQYVEGPFALAYANEKATQDVHYHWRHIEIYFSEHSISANYRDLQGSEIQSVELKEGGAIVFGPQVIHKVELAGFTLVIEVPAVASDKFNEEL